MAIEATPEQVGAALEELEQEADKELDGDEGEDDDRDDDLGDGGDDPDDGGDAGDDDDDLDDDDDVDDEDLEPGDDEDRPRDEKGRFAKDETPAPAAKPGEKAPAAASTDKAAAPVAAAAAATDAAPADKPKWEPLKITADKAEHAIPEVFGVQQHKGFKVVAVADDQWNNFTRRIGLGIVGGRMSRELDTRLREVEQIKKELAEKSENPEPTDAEVQAQVYLDALQGKGPYAEWFKDGDTPLTRAFEPWQLEILTRDAKLALGDRRKEWETKRTERKQSEEQATAEDTAFSSGLSEAIDVIAKENEDWDKLDIAQFKEIFADLGPLSRSILGKEKDGTLYVTDTGARVIRRALAGAAAGRKAAPATSTDPKPDAATAGDKHDRFNEAVNGAKAPPSTSVKDRRDTRDRSRNRGNRDERRSRGRDNRTEEQRAEDATRAAERNWLRSESLELPD